MPCNPYSSMYLIGDFGNSVVKRLHFGTPGPPTTTSNITLFYKKELNTVISTIILGLQLRCSCGTTVHNLRISQYDRAVCVINNVPTPTQVNMQNVVHSPATQSR